MYKGSGSEVRKSIGEKKDMNMNYVCAGKRDRQYLYVRENNTNYRTSEASVVFRRLKKIVHFPEISILLWIYDLLCSK